MTDYNEKIREFFLRLLNRKQAGIGDKYIEKVNSYSDSQLEIEYSELKSVIERKGKIVNFFISGILIAFLAGIWSIFLEFSRKITNAQVDSERSSTFVYGMFFVVAVISLLVLLSVILYTNRVSEKKKKFYYIETLMKKKGILK